MNKTLLTLLVGFLIIHSCSAQTWSKLEKNTFVNACIDEAKGIFTAEGAKVYCGCSLEKAMALYPNPDQIDNMTDEEAEILAMECLSVMLESEKDYFLGWTAEAKAEFVNACKEELMGSGLDSSYCNCALQETMKLYKNPYKAAYLTDEESDKIAEKCLGF